MGGPLSEIHSIQFFLCDTKNDKFQGRPSCPCAAANVPFIFQSDRTRHQESTNADVKLAKNTIGIL